MNKTIEEWLNTLKEPYRSEALGVCIKSRLDKQVNSLYNAIDAMVTWSNTKGGDDYWSPIHDTLMRNGNDPTYVRKSDEVINTYELY